MIARQLLFLFSALGAVNGVFLAVYFFTRQPRRCADCILGVLLVAVGIRTAKSTLLFFHPSLAIEFRQLGLSACLLIGPLTYLYVRQHLAENFGAPSCGRWRWHVGVAAAIIGVGVAFPYADYPAIWDRSSHGIHLYWLCYLLAGGRALWLARGVLRKPGAGMLANTVLSVYVGSCIILLAYATTPFTSYIVGALSFTFTVHIAVLVFLLRRSEKYRYTKLQESETNAILGALEEAMQGQKIYLNPNLTLAQLSKRIGRPSASVSQVLNDTLRKSFNAYVNEYRIAEAKKLLTSEPDLNLETVAERCGFNSNSTFFAAFKKVTQRTPASFRASGA
jgi:AraC-like DNA-binding protein